MTVRNNSHTIHIMMKQKDIAKLLGIKESYVCMLFSEDIKKYRPVSWPLAKRLSELFPDRTIHQWKNATPDDIKRAFAQIKCKKIKKG